MDSNTLAIGPLVLVGNNNWRSVTLRQRIVAVVRGRWKFVRDGNARIWVTWWQGDPYLIWIGGKL